MLQDTIMRFLRRKPRPIGERCYSALSGRSSQANSQNSQSNTDSCSQQSSLRYLETEMRRLRDSRRPLVVSFRRKQPPVQKVKQVTILDAELQRALDSLTEESKKIDKEGRSLKASRSSIRKCNDIIFTHERPTWANLNPDFGIIELHNLESSSGFAANGILKPSWQNCSDIDIEIFREQQLKLSNSKRSYNKLSVHEFSHDYEDANKRLTKSCTMPDMNSGAVPAKRPFIK